MKTRNMLISALLIGLLFLGTVYAAGGDAGDPLISLDYLQNTFLPNAEQTAQTQLDAHGKTLYDQAELAWRATVAAADAASGSERVSVWQEARLKQGDMLFGSTGTQIVLLAGNATAQVSGGTLVDVSDGTELASGNSLTQNHRYIAAEDTSVTVVVDSRTAALDYSGNYHFSPSGSTPDCYAMASALRTLTLFRGTGSGYGEGFDLETRPARIQALIMLLRLMGEENAALSCTSPLPFRDVPDWAVPYVAYAYDKGYTNGVSPTEFSPNTTANVGMYMEFVLRALGYSDTTQTDVGTAVDRAFSANVITAGERSMLLESDFFRSEVVYLSWYALETPLGGSSLTLHQKLEEAGVFTASEYRSALSSVSSVRL